MSKTDFDVVNCFQICIFTQAKTTAASSNRPIATL